MKGHVVCQEHVTIDDWMLAAEGVVATFDNQLVDSDWLLDTFIRVYRGDICTGTHCQLETT